MLEWAAVNGHDFIVKILIENGFDEHLKSTFEYTPLHWAVKNKYAKLVQTLLQKGVDVNTKDQVSSCTALDWAISQSLLNLNQI